MSIPPFGAAPTPNASASVAGKIKLAGDLAGTALIPVIADLAITSRKWKPTILSYSVASGVNDSLGSTVASTWTDINATSVTFTPDVTSSAIVLFNAGVYWYSNSAGASAEARWLGQSLLDGATPRNNIFNWQTASTDGFRHSVAMMTLYTGISAGSAHTIKMQQSYDGNGLTYGIAGAFDRSLIVVVFAE